MLNLTPKEFGDMQPYTFVLLINGYNDRKERQENYMAFFSSLMINYTRTVKLNRVIQPGEITKMLKGKTKRNIKEDREYLKNLFKNRLREVKREK